MRKMRRLSRSLTGALGAAGLIAGLQGLAVAQEKTVPTGSIMGGSGALQTYSAETVEGGWVSISPTVMFGKRTYPYGGGTETPVVFGASATWTIVRNLEVYGALFGFAREKNAFLNLPGLYATDPNTTQSGLGSLNAGLKIRFPLISPSSPYQLGGKFDYTFGSASQQLWKNLYDYTRISNDFKFTLLQTVRIGNPDAFHVLLDLNTGYTFNDLQTTDMALLGVALRAKAISNERFTVELFGELNSQVEVDSLQGFSDDEFDFGNIGNYFGQISKNYLTITPGLRLTAGPISVTGGVAFKIGDNIPLADPFAAFARPEDATQRPGVYAPGVAAIAANYKGRAADPYLYRRHTSIKRNNEAADSRVGLPHVDYDAVRADKYMVYLNGSLSLKLYDDPTGEVYRDTDGDGVQDKIDRCPNTPAGAIVDATGCPLDSDADGVYDGIDQCPNTPAGAVVDARGCPQDADGDGVYDGIDRCPNTPQGVEVDQYGCEKKETSFASGGVVILSDVNYDFNQTDIKPQDVSLLNNIGKFMEDNPNVRVEIRGHTDAIGSQEYNQALGQRRAQSAVSYLTQNFRLDAGRFQVVSYGEDRPLATNATAFGRAQNRRVEFQILNKDAIKTIDGGTQIYGDPNSPMPMPNNQ